MEHMGAALLQPYLPGAVIFLHGNLGAGKTTLVRAALRAQGYQGAVKSPTYTLVETYDLGTFNVAHFDLYRLGDPEELEYMGYRDYFNAHNICFLEWPDKGAGLLPPPDLSIRITFDQAGRCLQFSAETKRGETYLAALTPLLIAP